MKSAPVEVKAQHASQSGGTKPQVAHLHPNDQLGALLNHPAFQGFSRLMLPWDGRDYDKAMSLKDIGGLLPYHSRVEPSVVVALLCPAPPA